MIKPIEGMRVLKNKRVEENNFTMNDCCSYCEDYVTQVFEINWVMDICICKGCLNKMIKRLDDEMVNSFQPDFEEARKSYANATSIC